MRLSFATLVGLLAATVPVSSQVPFADTPVALGTQKNDIPTLAPLIRRVTPGVVNIAIKGRVAQAQNPLLKDPFFRRFFDVPQLPADRVIQAAGSGVIIEADKGLIVTSYHVVERADEIAVTLTDGRRLQASRVGTDRETDIAVIKVPPDGLTAIPLGDSDKLEVGDFVVAIGNPFGIGQTVTMGIVSALRRTGLGIKGYEDFIQTDASINPGNSGGALVNLRGELVGINSAILGPAGGNIGIGFAIPVNMVRQVVDQLVEFGEVRRGQLGITIQNLTSDLVEAMGLPPQQTGAVVAKVELDSPAERAGFKTGDVITAIGAMPVRGSADLRNKIGLLRVGDMAKLTVLRDGQTLTLRATVGARVEMLLQGEQASPLLEGAVFGPVGPAAQMSGIEVVSVRAGTKAWEAGLRKGDIITSVNQQPVANLDAFAAMVKASPKRMLLNLTRNGSAMFLVVQ